MDSGIQTQIFYFAEVAHLPPICNFYFFFSILLNKQQASAVQHPSDQPNLLVLVLGGITGGEINSMQEAWMSSSLGKAGGSLFVASTRLLSPNDTLQAVLKSNPQPL